MKVQAKCNAKAWDSAGAMSFVPGETYEIDPYGQLATLKAGGRWVFEFDRTMKGVGSKPAIGGYVCKCGKAFDTINEIGTHSYSAHADDREPEPEPEPEVEIVVPKSKQGHKPGSGFRCKSCSVVFPNLFALKTHKSICQNQQQKIQTSAGLDAAVL
jgi:C2H2-type zinc finger